MKHSRLTKPAIALLASLSLFATATCGSGGSGTNETVKDTNSVEELVKLAKKDGELNLYTSVAETQAKLLADAFQAKYGITVNMLRLNTAPLQQRYSSEAGTGAVNADVLVVSAPDIFADNPDWFTDITPKAVPGLDSYPKRAHDDRTIIASVFPYSYTYNTNLVSKAELPKTWTDLADPKWKGKIILTDPRTSPSYIGWADAVEKAFGLKYLEKLGDFHPDLAPSATPAAQQVAAGAYAISFPSQPVHPKPLMDAGAPVNYVIMDKPPVSLGISLGISSGSPHQYAARLYASWIITPEAQKLACSSGVVSSALSTDNEIPGCLPLSKDWAVFDSNLSDDRINELLDALQIAP